MHHPTSPYSRQTYWSGLPFPTPGDLPDPGIKPWSPALQADTWPSEPPGKPKEADLNLVFKVSSFQTFYFKNEKNKAHSAQQRARTLQFHRFFKTFFFFFLKNAYSTDPTEETSERTFSSLVWFSTMIITNDSNNEPHSPQVIKIKW